jgi:hypothetical protein
VLPRTPFGATIAAVNPELARELASLIVHDPSGAKLRARLSADPPPFPSEPILELAERAARSSATVEETALALGILAVLPSPGVRTSER